MHLQVANPAICSGADLGGCGGGGGGGGTGGTCPPPDSLNIHDCNLPTACDLYPHETVPRLATARIHVHGKGQL